MKKKILEALQTKFQGVEESILSRIAEKKANGVTDESQVPTIVEGVSLQDVLTSYGDFRAGQASATAVKNYEKEHKLKDGKKLEEKEEPTKPTPQESGSEDVPSWARSLIESNKSLSEKLTAFEAEKTKAARSEQISSKAKEYGIPTSLLPMLNISDDADLDEYFSGAKQTIADLGFKAAKAPESGAENKTDVDSLAEKIASGTKEIVEQTKK